MATARDRLPIETNEEEALRCSISAPKGQMQEQQVRITLSASSTQALFDFALDCGVSLFTLQHAFPAMKLSLPDSVEESLREQFVGVRALTIDRIGRQTFGRRVPAWRFNQESAFHLEQLFPRGLSNLSAPGNLRLVLYSRPAWAVNSRRDQLDVVEPFLITFMGTSREALAKDPEKLHDLESDARMFLTHLQVTGLQQAGLPFYLTQEDGREKKVEPDRSINKSYRPPSLSTENFDIDRFPLRSEGMDIAQNDILKKTDLFRWWKTDHDNLLRSWIEKRDWLWQSDYKQITSLCSEAEVDSFRVEVKDHHPGAWYNVIDEYARARAKVIVPSYKRQPQWKTCILCELPFHESRAYTRWYKPDSIVVCEPCHKKWMWSGPVENSSKEEIAQYLLRLTNLIGRVPPAQYEFTQVDFLTFDATQVAEAFALQKIRPSQTSINQAYGSWFAGLVDTGILADGERKGRFGTECIALDGHRCLSIGEKMIDDFLQAEGIDHEREIWYADGTFRADFRVGQILIEYFGLSGNASYDEKTNRKLQYCRDKEIALISIYPNDLINIVSLEAKLGTLRTSDKACTALFKGTASAVPPPSPAKGL